jgi:AbrB family looped-hinge helix DNA binding protein
MHRLNGLTKRANCFYNRIEIVFRKNIMHLKVQSIGNSLMVTIPKHIREKLNLKAGSTILMDYDDKKIEIKKEKVDKKKKFGEDIETISIPNINHKQMMKYIKEGAYDR